MRPLLLHLDDAIERQSTLVSRSRDCGGRSVDARALGPCFRLWSRPLGIASLRASLRDHPYNPVDPDVVFTGSGDFHHVTLLLVERAIEAIDGDVTVLHFDNHPDWVRFEDGAHCGSWAARAARIAGVSQVITVGVCSTDILGGRAKEGDHSVVADGLVSVFPYALPSDHHTFEMCGRRWPTISAVGEDEFPAFLAAQISTRNVYVTIDKDVLRGGDAITNWDQGRTSLPFLQSMLDAVASHHQLIGADIVGDWSRPAYGSTLLDRVMKRGESLLDQPWTRPDADLATAVNERTNLVLMDFFAERVS